MTNKLKGEVSLTGPAGEAFTLVFDWEALVLVEDSRDKSFADVVEELDAGRLGALGALLWAAMRRHQPKTTLGQAGVLALALAADGRDEELKAKIIEAITLGFPTKKEVGAAKADPPQTEAAAST